MKSRLLGAFEFVLSISGGVLLCLYVVFAMDRYAQARVALAEAALQTANPIERSESRSSVFLPADHERAPDFSLWSAERIVAFERAFGVVSGQPIALLRIRRVALEAPIFQDTSQINLNRGIGWIAGTSRPGESGNIGIAGHRDSFFRALKDVVPSDEIELISGDVTYVYRVVGTQVVHPEDTWVLDRDEDPSLTLVTCYPFYFFGNAPRRFVVKAHLVARLQTARNRVAEKRIEP